MSDLPTGGRELVRCGTDPMAIVFVPKGWADDLRARSPEQHLDLRFLTADLQLLTLDRPLLTLVQSLLNLDLALLTLDLQLLASDRAFLTREEREDQAVKTPHHLRMPLSDFVLEANRLAGAVVRHAERLSTASGGRISTQTAKDMQNLTEEILRIERERARKAVGSMRPLIRRAEQQVAEIGRAARFIALDKPIVAEQLERIRSGRRRRSAPDATLALQVHLGLVREHASEFATLLAEDFVNEAARTHAAMEQQRESQRTVRDEAAAQTRRRDEHVVRLQKLVSAVRALAASVFREEEAAKEFASPPKRSTRRQRPSPTEAEPS